MQIDRTLLFCLPKIIREQQLCACTEGFFFITTLDNDESMSQSVRQQVIYHRQRMNRLASASFFLFLRDAVLKIMNQLGLARPGQNICSTDPRSGASNVQPGRALHGWCDSGR